MHGGAVAVYLLVEESVNVVVEVSGIHEEEVSGQILRLTVEAGGKRNSKLPRYLH